MRQRVGSCLEDTADTDEAAPEGNRLFSSQDVSGTETEDCTEDASDCVGGNDLTLQSRAWVIESAEEVWVREQAAEDALIVTCTECQ